VIRLNRRRTYLSPSGPPSAQDLRAAWVDLDPPLVVAGLGPAIAVRTGSRRRAARRRHVHPSAGGRAGERAAVAPSPPCRSSSDKRSRLDPLGYGSAEESLDGGASTHRQTHAPARRPATAPSPGELRSTVGCGVAAWREKAQMNPRVRARAPKPVLFSRNPRVAVGYRWTAHV
jgi:hypothetical protein